MAAVASAAFLALALLWNRIPYPSYGIEFLALSPVHFLQMGLTLHAGREVRPACRRDADRALRRRAALAAVPGGGRPSHSPRFLRGL